MRRRLILLEVVSVGTSGIFITHIEYEQKEIFLSERRRISSDGCYRIWNRFGLSRRGAYSDAFFGGFYLVDLWCAIRTLFSPSPVCSFNRTIHRQERYVAFLIVYCRTRFNWHGLSHDSFFITFLLLNVPTSLSV